MPAGSHDFSLFFFKVDVLAVTVDAVHAADLERIRHCQSEKPSFDLSADALSSLFPAFPHCTRGP